MYILRRFRVQNFLFSSVRLNELVFENDQVLFCYFMKSFISAAFGISIVCFCSIGAAYCQFMDMLFMGECFGSLCVKFNLDRLPFRLRVESLIS